MKKKPSLKQFKRFLLVVMYIIMSTAQKDVAAIVLLKQMLFEESVGFALLPNLISHWLSLAWFRSKCTVTSGS